MYENRNRWHATFSDDQVVIVYDQKNLEHKAEKLVKQYGKWKISVNEKKPLSVHIQCTF